jgi:hypothetical protein
MARSPDFLCVHHTSMNTTAVIVFSVCLLAAIGNTIVQRSQPRYKRLAPGIASPMSSFAALLTCLVELGALGYFVVSGQYMAILMFFAIWTMWLFGSFVLGGFGGSYL